MGRHNFLNYARMAKSNFGKRRVQQKKWFRTLVQHESSGRHKTRRHYTDDANGKRILCWINHAVGRCVERMHAICVIFKISIGRKIKKKSGNTQKHLGNHESFWFVWCLVEGTLWWRPFFLFLHVANDSVYWPGIVQSFSNGWPKIKIYLGE